MFDGYVITIRKLKCIFITSAIPFSALRKQEEYIGYGNMYKFDDIGIKFFSSACKSGLLTISHTHFKSLIEEVIVKS